MLTDVSLHGEISTAEDSFRGHTDNGCSAVSALDAVELVCVFAVVFFVGCPALPALVQLRRRPCRGSAATPMVPFLSCAGISLILVLVEF